MARPTLRRPCGYPDNRPDLNDEVRELQRALNRWGYQLKAEGYFGPITDASVRSFQRKKGLEPDGIVGPKTWAAVLARGNADMSTGNPPRPPAAPPPEPARPSPAGAGNAPAWMKFAKAEVGVHEVAGKAKNPRIIEYHAATTLGAKSDEIAWCASFVNWCLQKAGIRGTRSAAAASFATWGDATEARYGAICVIYNASAANSRLSTSGNHVGFLVEETGTHFVMLGGNQSDSVKVSNFPKSKWRLKGRRWPG
ncbi:TIGR02594 family protein [Polyangium aurulentum]|uniref:NlpC/P60 family protein n=1 Tax=Polyangium aurulentum TaxID=2567896 RepID=UPI0010AE8342|nr:TIGR02594 family protein [Polyangium aurulentum]UQA55190.1 TIGR02594 family protein [Polyangium aurulentum]